MQVNTATQSNAQTSGTVRETSSSLDKDAFLRLLVEQLKNQDPMNPQDSSAFMAQMAQFTMVEQLTNLNEEIVSLNEGMGRLIISQEMAEASGLLGRQVGVQTEDGLVSGLVEKVVMDEEGIKIFVNGNSYNFKNVIEITDSSSAAQNP